jgi:hypothetical protein
MSKAIYKILLAIPNAKWYSHKAHWHLHPYPLTLITSMLDRKRFQLKIVDTNIDNLSPDSFSEVIAD